MKKLFLFSGEPSGDRLGALLIDELLKQDKTLSITAVAGPEMRKRDISTFLTMEHFAVMGFLDVIKELPRLRKQSLQILHFLLEEKPDIVLFIDYPGFSIRMAQQLKKHQFKGSVIQYVCPSVWAWKKNRIGKIEKAFDLLISLFPFEKTYFSPSFPVYYAGHPFASSVQKAASFDSSLITLYPGSRLKVIERNLPLQLEALLEETKDRSFSIGISCSSDAAKEAIKKIINKHPHPSIFLFSSEENSLWMQKSYLALATSGTITLELALHELPALVTYQLSFFDYILAKFLFRISLPYYCIVNILRKKEVFPEFIGPFSYKTLLKKNIRYFLDNIAHRKERQEECKSLKAALAPQPEIASSILSCIKKLN